MVGLRYCATGFHQQPVAGAWRRGAEVRPSPDVAGLDGLSVLVMEDDCYVAEDLRTTLEGAGARVIGPFADAAAAIAAADRDRPDCAVVDLNLGRGPNLAPTRALLGRDVPVVILTGYGVEVVPEELRHLPFVQKPAPMAQLVAAVTMAAAIEFAPPAPARNQFAALPWRAAGPDVEVLLITSRDTGRWVIPKGWPIKGLRWEASAAREAYEEAGVMGVASNETIGVYHYGKRMQSGRTHPVRVLVFPLEVISVAESWPERDQRNRCWMAPRDAAALVDEPELKLIISSFAPAVEGAGASPPAERGDGAPATPGGL